MKQVPMGLVHIQLHGKQIIFAKFVNVINERTPFCSD